MPRSPSSSSVKKPKKKSASQKMIDKVAGNPLRHDRQMRDETSTDEILGQHKFLGGSAFTHDLDDEEQIGARLTQSGVDTAVDDNDTRLTHGRLDREFELSKQASESSVSEGLEEIDFDEDEGLEDLEQIGVLEVDRDN